MKRSKKTNALLKNSFFIIATMVVIASFFLSRIGKSQETVEGTVTSVLPALSSLATVSPTSFWLTPSTILPSPTLPLPTATSISQPSQCTFPLANVEYPESQQEEYIFSDPQVVLTAPQGNIYAIAEWLPDNQEVLITEELNNGFVPGNDNSSQQSISLFNPETKETRVFAIRQTTHQIPSWHPRLNAIVYPVMNYFDIDRKNQTYKLSREIWISYGDLDTVSILAADLPQLSFAIKPDGNEMIYLLDDSLSKRDKTLKEVAHVSVDSMEWDYASRQREGRPVSYNMVWQPNTPLVFLYNDWISGSGGYTFILNTDTGKICELNLGGWAISAHWSSDGRYLAIGRATNSQPADLTLLDATTGTVINLNGTPQGVEGKLYLNDFIWAPDNHHLLVIGSVVSPINSQDHTQGLYLVDIASSPSIDLTPTDKFYTNTPQSIAWSLDSSKIVVRCPTVQLDRICFISVQKIIK